MKHPVFTPRLGVSHCTHAWPICSVVLFALWNGTGGKEVRYKTRKLLGKLLAKLLISSAFVASVRACKDELPLLVER